MKLIKTLALSIGFTLLNVVAYAPMSVCPADALLDLARAASACYGLEHEQVCVGSGLVTASGHDGVVLSDFTLAGQRAPANTLQRVTTQIQNNEIAIVSFSLQTSLTELEARQVTMLLIGDVSLTNKVAPLVEQVAYARGTVNIRTSPQPDSDILARIGVNESLVVNGRTDDNPWLRAQVRDSNDVGWVATEVVSIDNRQALPIAVSGEVVKRPFEIMNLISGDTALCDDSLPSGLLLQTPSPDTEITLTLNDTPVTLAGTFFIQANLALTVFVLSGQAVIRETFVSAGAVAHVNDDDINVTGYDLERLAGLPLTALPTFTQITSALTETQITQSAADYAAVQAAQVATPEAVPMIADDTCHRFVRRDVSLYAGPGDFYEAINELQSGTGVDPVFQTTNPNGAVWYQLRGSNWIAARQVVEEGDCPSIPVTTNVESPLTNTLSLETCQTTNGPLRAGQYVTIQFTPAPWPNYGEARDAHIIDPGRITIGSQRYRPQATQAVLIAGTIGEDDERWLRQFYIVWEAVRERTVLKVTDSHIIRFVRSMSLSVDLFNW